MPNSKTEGAPGLVTPKISEDKRAAPRRKGISIFARNPKLSRFDQITVLSEAHNSPWDFMRVFREQTGACSRQIKGTIKKPAHGWKVKAVPTGKMKKMTDSGCEANHCMESVRKPQLPLECYCKAPEENSMIKKVKTGPASARTILLVDDSPIEKHIRAIMLNTHGYEVDSISNTDDAYCFSQTKHPDLVLLALSQDSDGEISSLGAHKTRQSSTAGRFFDQQFVLFEPSF